MPETREGEECQRQEEDKKARQMIRTRKPEISERPE